MFETIMNVIGTPFGYIMWACYQLISSYWVSILLFTLVTKLILFPVSLKVQQNSVKMVQLQPKLIEARLALAGDKDALAEEEMRIYRENHYSPAMGCLPTLIQIPIILGLINVIYNPLRHLLHLPAEVISALVATASTILGRPELGASAQLTVVQLVNDPAHFSQFAALSGVEGLEGALAAIASLDMNFFGLNLAATPSITSITPLILIPILSGVTTWVMCEVQNRFNVLQAGQGALSKYGVTIFLIAFSTYFAFVVPAGVGLYWTFSNLLSTLLVFLLNAIYNPKKYIDFETKEKMDALMARQKQLDREGEAHLKENRTREKADAKRFNDTEGKEVVFYSEKSGFYKYFKGHIENILGRSDLTIHYVTNDPDDVVFTLDNPRIIGYYVGDKRIIPLMMKMESAVVVMTTPDLENFHIKRSLVQKDIEYIYTDHGITNALAAYRENALDHFDTLFCVGPHQKEEYLETEKLYHLAPRNLVEVGFPLLEEMVASYEAGEKPRHERPQILVAPSWTADSLMALCLDELLAGLLGHGYHIILRPHPEYIKRQRLQMEAVVERYKDVPPEELTIQTDFSSSETVYQSDLVITDWSSIAQEFSYTTKKPCLFVNTPMKVLNPNWTRYKTKPLEVEQREVIGRSVDIDNLDKVHESVDYLLGHQEAYRQIISDCVDRYIYNFGHSGEVGADYIVGRVRAKRAQRQAEA